MTLTSRLKKAEQGLEALKPERCDHCRDWQEPRVVIDYAPGVELYADDTPPPNPRIPEQCPVCGWRPREMRILLDYDDEPLKVSA